MRDDEGAAHYQVTSQLELGAAVLVLAAYCDLPAVRSTGGRDEFRVKLNSIEDLKAKLK